MKVTLERAFKNHPKGTVLDVSEGVYDLLVRNGLVQMEKESGEKVEKPRRKPRAVSSPPADRMVHDEEVETK